MPQIVHCTHEQLVPAGASTTISALLVRGMLISATARLEGAGAIEPQPCELYYADESATLHQLRAGWIRPDPNEHVTWIGSLPVRQNDELQATIVNNHTADLTLAIAGRVMRYDQE